MVGEEEAVDYGFLLEAEVGEVGAPVIVCELCDGEGRGGGGGRGRGVDGTCHRGEGDLRGYGRGRHVPRIRKRGRQVMRVQGLYETLAAGKTRVIYLRVLPVINESEASVQTNFT